MKNIRKKLSEEQNEFIDIALAGHNVLVDACIGSGKTTSIQALCDELPKNKKILYMTYNRLLKLDAQDKIKNRNVTVTNYHGFVYPYLKKHKIHCGIGESIREFNRLNPEIKKYDVLIIDEYQDINLECSELLEIIKKSNSKLQIIAVGDMEQKIYDFTTHDVEPWIKQYLGNFKPLSFTKCFRLNAAFADKLSKAWNKPITGVNKTQKVRLMHPNDVVDYLKDKNPEDILALSPKKGQGVDVLNELQDIAPETFNKYTTYASINNTDFNVDPDAETAIFTTYDSSKGMERPICVIFDYMDDYLSTRLNMPDINPNIIRNIFLVAASRGKDEIIFVSKRKAKSSELNDNDENIGFIPIEDFIDMPVKEKSYQPFNVSTMFSFKYVEDIEASRDLLDIKQIKTDNSQILNIRTSDALLDLSPAIPIYALGSFFEDFDVYDELAHMAVNNEISSQRLEYYKDSLKFQLNKEFGGNYEDIVDNPKLFGMVKEGKKYSSTFKHDKPDLQWELLVLLAAEYKLLAYIRQVNRRYVTSTEKQLLKTRLGSILNKNDLHNIKTNLVSMDISFNGQADAINDNIAYSLIYVDEIKSINYLICAMQIIMLGLEKGRVWNLRTNELQEITIPDRQAFLDQVVATITKRNLNKFTGDIPEIDSH